MTTKPKGKRPFGLTRTKPYTKAQVAEHTRKSTVVLGALSSDQRVLENTQSLKDLEQLLMRPLP